MKKTPEIGNIMEFPGEIFKNIRFDQYDIMLKAIHGYIMMNGFRRHDKYVAASYLILSCCCFIHCFASQHQYHFVIPVMTMP